MNANGSLFGPPPRADLDIDLTGKTIVITGGNTGLGFEAAKVLTQMGGSVVLACRDMEKCRVASEEILRVTGSKNVECLELDLASFESIDSFAKRYHESHERLDVLINNAGMMGSNKGTTKDGLGVIMGVNYYGPFRLTYRLLPMILDSKGRIVNVSSDMHRMGEINLDDVDMKNFTDESFSGLHKSYANSKLGNMLFTQSLAKKLNGSGVPVVTITPGLVRTQLVTDFTGFDKFLMELNLIFAMSMEQGVQNYIYAAASPDIVHYSGHYFKYCKPAEYVHENTKPENNLRDLLWDHTLCTNKLQDFNSWEDLRKNVN